MNINSIPRHADAGIDKVSCRARSIQGPNDGLTYNQERRITEMANLLADRRHGPHTVLTSKQCSVLHIDVAEAASKEFGRPVEAWNVKLALKSSRYEPAIKTVWPIDAGERGYARVARKAERDGTFLNKALSEIIDAYFEREPI